MTQEVNRDERKKRKRNENKLENYQFEKCVK